MKILSRLTLVLLLLPLTLFARIESHQFDTPEQEALYLQLTQELRCLVCQNQNLADSNADLAKDLREKTYEMIMQGKDRQQIVDYMVERYGDFVLYRPPVQKNTYALWIGPFIFLLIAVIVLISYIRKRASSTDTPPDEEIEAARKYLDN